MKRYVSFRKLKKAAEPSGAQARPQAEEEVVAFLQLVKNSIQPIAKPKTKAHD